MKATLNILVAKCLPALFLMPVSANVLAQAKPLADDKGFKITIEATETGLKLESLQGSAWLTLNFTTSDDKPQAIDEYGMAKLAAVSPTKDVNLADFLFTVTKTPAGVTLKGIEGTAWTELSFTLAQHKKQTIDQFGMTQ